MGIVRLRYYVVKRNGFSYWIPNSKMKAAGFRFRSLGPAGPQAEAEAHRLNRQWDAHRRGDPAEAAGWPAGSLGEAFEAFRATSVWREKSVRSREEWDRAWVRIAAVFGDVDPRTVTLDQVSGFRDLVRDLVSASEAHRTIKIWRALWKKAAALGYCAAPADPSLGFANTSPPKRQAVWSRSEILALGKHAWKMGLPQIACVLSIAWDTLLSPTDIRTLRADQLRTRDGLVWFELRRAKTGRTAYATLSRRSVRILGAWLDSLGNVTIAPDAPLLRDTTGKPLDKNRLGRLFRRVRDDLMPGDDRTLADIRRSGAVEAIRAGAAVEALTAKMANTLGRSNFLFATYVPPDLDPIRALDEARRRAPDSAKSLIEPAGIRLLPRAGKPDPA